MEIVHIPQLLVNASLERTADTPADKPESLYFDFYEELEKENLVVADGAETRAHVTHVGQLLLNIVELKRDASLLVGEWINRFSAELAGIDNGLIEAKLQLAKLQVYLDEQAIKDAEIKLLAECSTVTSLFGYYTEHIAEADVKSAVLNKFQTVNSASHVLRSYSFATVYTVAFAFLTEVELMRLLNVGTPTMQNVAREYYTYFNRCIDPNLNGSVGSSLKAADNTLVLMQQEYNAGNKGRLDRGFSFLHNTELVCRCGGPRCESDRYVTYRNYTRLWRDYVIEGNLAEGFTGSLGDLVQKDALGRSLPGDLVGGNEANANAAAAQYLQSTILPKYANAASLFTKMKAERDVLAGAVAYTTEYRDFSHSIAF